MNAEQWQQAETLFHAALDLRPADPASWIAGNTPADPVVAAAVLRMLEADSSGGDEIRRAIRSAVKQWLGEPNSPKRDPRSSI